MLVQSYKEFRIQQVSFFKLLFFKNNWDFIAFNCDFLQQMNDLTLQKNSSFVLFSSNLTLIWARWLCCAAFYLLQNWSPNLIWKTECLPPGKTKILQRIKIYKWKVGKMWAEARKQEKKIRGIMVDHKKRAERRREYYEKIVSISFFVYFLVYQEKTRWIE